ncbi:MAG: LAGLIDADG family homing endonuclease [Candidatus Aenigmarchaeota archaeon]|nr:LAGLIDADG family homing endonuclease [Candidatus Aenigmarchaeota archaeon]
MNLDYLAGFFDGEGSFIVRFVPDKRYRNGFQIHVTINITQKNFEILKTIKNALKMGYISYHKRDNLWHYNIYKKQDVFQFLELIKGRVVVKREQLLRFEHCIKMVCNKEHLNAEGLKKIQMMWSVPKTARNTR